MASEPTAPGSAGLRASKLRPSRRPSRATNALIVAARILIARSRTPVAFSTSVATSALSGVRNHRARWMNPRSTTSYPSVPL